MNRFIKSRFLAYLASTTFNEIIISLNLGNFYMKTLTISPPRFTVIQI